MKFYRGNISATAEDCECQRVMEAFALADIELVDAPSVSSSQAIVHILGCGQSLDVSELTHTPDLLVVFGQNHGYVTAAHQVFYWTGCIEVLAKQLSGWFLMAPPELPAELNMIGESPALMHSVAMIKCMAEADAPVLIKGETGTGKEVAARAIHYLSNRQGGPFVPVNCGAYTDELFLSEFFGFERGAFTDAKQARAGLVEQAENGTLFLDEIDSLSLKAQVTLLRFLQNYEYRRLGSKQPQYANVRIVAASNKKLHELVVSQAFREDLFYRLDILSLDVPPLRQRIDDLVLLCTYFLDQLSRRYRQPSKYLSTATLQWMCAYDWPGNIRELENYLHKLYILSPLREIHVPAVKGVPDPTLGSEQDCIASGGVLGNDSISVSLAPFKEEKARAVEQFERQYLQKVMQQCNGNVSEAARLAGKERRSFTRLIEKYDVSREQFLSI